MNFLVLFIFPFISIYCSNAFDVEVAGTEQHNTDFTRPIGTRKPVTVVPVSTVPAAPTAVLDTAEDVSSLINYRTSRAASGSDEGPATKRRKVAKKHRFSFLDLSLTHEQLIEAEINAGRKLTQSREISLRKLFQFFSTGHGYNFTPLTSFKADFNCNIYDYTRNGVQQYALIMALVLGCESYSESYNLIRDSYVEDIVVDIFKYLFTHTSFERAIKSAYAISGIKFTPEESTELREFINQKYPQMIPYHKILLDLMFAGYSIRNLEGNVGESDDNMLIAIMNSFYLIHYVPHEGSPIDIIHRIPLEYPEFYFGSSVAFKFSHLSCVYMSDRVKILETILGIDPNLVLYVRHDPGCKTKNTIFTMAVRHHAPKCFQYLLELVPDIITSDIDLELSVINRAILGSKYHNEYDTFLDILTKNGVNADFILTENNISMNLIQYSFIKGIGRATLHFMRLAGPEKSHASIYAVWSSDNNIVKHVINRFDSFKDVVEFCRILGIDLTRRDFRNGNLIGDFSIFITREVHSRFCTHDHLYGPLNI